MDKLSELGLLGLGSRFKRLADTLYEQVGGIYGEIAADLNPRAFPLLHVLSDQTPRAIGDLAKELNLSHPAIIKMADLLIAKGLIQDGQDKSDLRKRTLSLTSKGRRLVKVLLPTWSDLEQALREIIEETGYDLLDALQRFESKVKDGGYRKRVLLKQDAHSESKIEIVSWNKKYAKDFHSINQEWIEKHFTYESSDIALLEHPERSILAPGGEILFALIDGEVVGTCALLHAHFGMELTKMGVAPKAQGKRVGVRLCKAAIQKASEMGVSRLFLESNRVLEPAIEMYKKLGFREIPDPRGPSKYSRADIYMEYPSHLMRKAA